MLTLQTGDWRPDDSQTLQTDDLRPADNSQTLQTGDSRPADDSQTLQTVTCGLIGTSQYLAHYLQHPITSLVLTRHHYQSMFIIKPWKVSIAFEEMIVFIIPLHIRIFLKIVQAVFLIASIFHKDLYQSMLLFVFNKQWLLVVFTYQSFRCA